MLYIYIISIVSSIVLLSYKSIYKQKEGILTNTAEININKIDILYNKEKILKNSIDQYIMDTGTIPPLNDIDFLKNNGYLSEGFYNNNGFNSGSFYFSVNNDAITINSQINNNLIQSKYLNYYKNKENIYLSDYFKPYKESPSNDTTAYNVLNNYLISQNSITRLHKPINKSLSTLNNTFFSSCEEINKYDPSLPEGTYKLDENQDGIIDIEKNCLFTNSTCEEIYQNSEGPYEDKIYILSGVGPVYCDMTNGGWMLVARIIKENEMLINGVPYRKFSNNSFSKFYYEQTENLVNINLKDIPIKTSKETFETISGTKIEKYYDSITDNTTLSIGWNDQIATSENGNGINWRQDVKIGYVGDFVDNFDQCGSNTEMGVATVKNSSFGFSWQSFTSCSNADGYYGYLRNNVNGVEDYSLTYKTNNENFKIAELWIK